MQWSLTLLSGQRLIPAVMVVGTPLYEGDKMVGEAVVCRGVGERILITVVLLDGTSRGRTAIRHNCMCHI